MKTTCSGSPNYVLWCCTFFWVTGYNLNEVSFVFWSNIEILTDIAENRRTT